MELSDKYKKYSELNIDNIPDIEDNFINELVKQQAKDLDNIYCEFLEENGYKLDYPYTVIQLKEIQKDLEKQDKFLDYLEYTKLEKTNTGNITAYDYIIPFFNSISNPLSEETRNEIIEKWKEKNRKDK